MAKRKSVNQKLADTILQHQHYLIAVEQGTIKKMAKPFRQAFRDVKTKLAQMNYAPTSTWTGRRAMRLEKELAGLMEAAAEDAAGTLKSTLVEVIKSENIAATGILKDTLPAPVDTLVTFERIPMEHIEKMIQTPLGGATLNGRLKTLVSGAGADTRSALQSSIILGEGMDKAARRIRHLVQKKSFYNATRIARTEIQRNSALVHRQLYDRHTDVVSGIQFMATLDDRTCPQCGMFDGARFYYKGGSPSVGSAPDIPLHPMCFVDPQVPISVPDGEKPIGKIEVGDLVLTHTGQCCPVTELIRQHKWRGEVYTVTTGIYHENSPRQWGKVTVTKGHPILVQRGLERFWLPVESLCVGDSLLTPMNLCLSCGNLPQEFSEAKITEITSEVIIEPVTTFNFSVAEDESYVAAGIVVHNCRCLFLPITKSWKQLGFTDKDLKGFPGLKDMDELGAKTLTYGDWLKQQPKAVQLNILGPKRYDQWKKGKLKFRSASQALPKKLKPIPPKKLKTLRGMDPKAPAQKPLEMKTAPFTKREVTVATRTALLNAGLTRKQTADYFRNMRSVQQKNRLGGLHTTFRAKDAIRESIVTEKASLAVRSINDRSKLWDHYIDVKRKAEQNLARAYGSLVDDAIALNTAAPKTAAQIGAFLSEDLTTEQIKKLIASVKPLAGEAKVTVTAVRKSLKKLRDRNSGTQFFVKGRTGTSRVGASYASSTKDVPVRACYSQASSTGSSAGFTAPDMEMLNQHWQNWETVSNLKDDSVGVVFLSTKKTIAAAAEGVQGLEAQYALARTWAHEMGHALERANPGIKKAATALHARRVSGPLRDLSTLYPGSMAGEMTTLGNFHSAYTGKVYTDGATEIVSMATEHLPTFMKTKNLTVKQLRYRLDVGGSTDIDWACYDPEHFTFLLNIVSGSDKF